MRDALTDIRGIGDAKADAILEVVKAEATDAEIAALIEQAHDSHQAGDHEYAAKYVRRAYERLPSDAD